MSIPGRVILDFVCPNMNPSKPTRIRWWEPRWSFVPRELRGFQKAVPLRSWLRIMVISAAITVAVALLANAFMPNLQFNWIGAFLISVAASMGIVAAMPLLVITFPRLVFVTETEVGWWWPPLLHDGVTCIKRADLKSVTLTIRDDEKRYLRFQTHKRRKRIGVARNVELESLCDMFGELLIVRDRRRGRQNLHGSNWNATSKANDIRMSPTELALGSFGRRSLR